MKRTTQHTATAAVLAFGAELSRRGYDVTFTMGNTPKIDMMCAVPDRPAFKIQVKGISNRASFFVGEKFFEGDAQSDLYLVVVYVPKCAPKVEIQEPMEFFILTHKEAKAEFDKLPKKKRDGQDYKEGTSGLTWNSISKLNYKDKWDSFPKLDQILSLDETK